MKRVYVGLLFILVLIFAGCGGGESKIDNTLQKSKDTSQQNRKINRSEIKTKVESIDLESNSFGDTSHLSLERGLVDIVYLGDKYKEDQLLLKDENGSAINDTFSITGTVDMSKEGEYIQSYFITIDGIKSGFKKHIFVVKNTPPHIELIGDPIMEIELGKSVTIPFAKAQDREEFDTINSEIKLSGSVDLYRPGLYELVYSVTDERGLSDSVKRVVEVKAKDDMKLSFKSLDLGAGYEMLDYLKLSEDHNVDTYSHKTYIQTQNYKKISNGYELRGVRFIFSTPDSEKDSFRLLWLNESSEVQDEIKIDRVLWLNDEVSNGCRLREHYDKITIANKSYSDVIKIECSGRAEAYYQKDYGLIAQNILLPREGDAKVLKGKDLIGRDLMNIEPLYSSFNLDGRGVKIGVLDEGFVQNDHIELKSRVEWVKGSNSDIGIGDHATHVAGIIAAKGIDKEAIGVATSARLFSYSYKQFRTVDALSDMLEKGIYLSNHSYGPQTDEVYSFMSQNSDHFVYQHPLALVVNSAGNSREDDGYWIIKDFSSAKNIITVGAIDKDRKITDFSSTGPVNSGRIKPDIVGYGEHVKSTIDSDYGYMRGTSMSAPHITGLLALLEEEYRRVNNVFMPEDVAKAILANSALDLGRKGPDYEYGYGLPNGLKAVKIIESMGRGDSHVVLSSVSEKGSKEFTLHLSKEQNIKLTLSWIDPAYAAPYVGDEIHPALNTILSIKLIDKDGKIYYPWSLDDENPTFLARRDRENQVDNLQQIEAHLKSGNYKIVVENRVMNIGVDQNFVLVSSLPISGKVLNDEELERIEFGYFLMGLY